MTYEVIIHQKVAKQIKDLPESHQQEVARLLNILEYIAIPFTEFDIKKIKGKAYTYRVRFGDYRLIYELNKKENKIQILKLKPRKKAYK
ncbi:MAG: type II toxin-antitoxin system RelE/ParE family toxin [Candidatus Helarchaeota archaeon]|nr:type II toxin-antitoxin system RelE/ParE family toxin [Candidatus Helarchaeota archaeon]